MHPDSGDSRQKKIFILKCTRTLFLSFSLSFCLSLSLSFCLSHALSLSLFSNALSVSMFSLQVCFSAQLMSGKFLGLILFFVPSLIVSHSANAFFWVLCSPLALP